jgi:hypothetical protein
MHRAATVEAGREAAGRPALLRPLVVSSIVPLAIGLVLGGAVILIELQGTGAKPAPVGVALVAVGVAAGLAPLRTALPVVVVLAAYEGFFNNFVGGPSNLWEEAFTVTILARAVLRRSPSRVELGLGAGLALVFGLYVLTGTDLDAAGLGLKLLVMFVLVGWAVARLEAGWPEWWALYQGLAVVVASSVVVAAWQRHYGADGLMNLGLTDVAVPPGTGGELRPSGGLLYPGQLGYTLAVATLCWVALFLGRKRQHALATLWLPALALAGMTLSLTRTAFVAATCAVLIVTVRRGSGRKLLIAALAMAGAFALVAPATASFLGSGFTGNTASASGRLEIWSERASDLSVFGAGPGSAGAAVRKLHPELRANPENWRTETLVRRGVVDNQYLLWLYQYGYLGGIALCLVWFVGLGALLLSTRPAGPAGIAAQLLAGYALIAALSSNMWEEFPFNILLALIIGVALASGSVPMGRVRPRPAVQS